MISLSPPQAALCHACRMPPVGLPYNSRGGGLDRSISSFKPIPEIYSRFLRNYEIKFLYKIYGERILVVQQRIYTWPWGRPDC